MFPDFKNGYDFSEKSIGTIYITGAGYVKYPFKGIGVDSAFGYDKLVWKKTPTRGAGNFAFSNLDTIEIGKVAQCEVTIPYQNYDDYIVLRKIVENERHFQVEFFNVDQKKWVSRDMYCSENSKQRFYMLSKKLIGVQDITLKFVGTNLDVKTALDENNREYYYVGKKSVKYYENSTLTQTDNVNYAGHLELKDSTSETVPTGKHFSGWIDKDSNGNIKGYYGAGQSITVWNNLNLYPWWENA